MLVIRAGQLSALSQARLASFESKMCEHLRSVYPNWSLASATDPAACAALRNFVRHGRARAEQYGFGVELDIARYLHVMHDLGQRFDESPEYPWAPSLLTQNISETEKMNRLRDARDYQLEARRIRHGS
jgi:hypothetical protein